MSWMTGAGIGSLGGPVTAVGGGILGGSSGWKRQWNDAISGVQGSEAPNAFTDPDTAKYSNDAIKALLQYQGDQNILDPSKSSIYATQQVQNNPILAQLFGKGGALERTGAEEQQLASRGFSLQPEDYEAYGQASGNIAREFDRGEASLAQALANRGLSQSGVAGQQFMTSQGSKLEALGQMQRQLANDRMQMNLQRLGQTRNLLTQLGAQGENAIQQQFGRGMESEKARFGETQAKADQGMNWLKALQGQGNEGWEQQQATRVGSMSEQFQRGQASAQRAAPMQAQNTLFGMGGKALGGM